MHFVGARFRDQHDAELALDDLRARFGLGPEDAGLERLGSTAYERASPEDVLLAGRFHDERLGELRAVVEEHGGEIVADGTA